MATQRPATARQIQILRRTFGARISDLRAHRGLSPQALATAVHVTRPTLVGWERGAGRITMPHVFALAKALRVPPAVLFESDAQTISAKAFDRLADLAVDDPAGDLELHIDRAKARRPGRATVKARQPGHDNRRRTS